MRTRTFTRTATTMRPLPVANTETRLVERSSHPPLPQAPFTPLLPEEETAPAAIRQPGRCRFFLRTPMLFLLLLCPLLPLLLPLEFPGDLRHHLMLVYPVLLWTHLHLHSQHLFKCLVHPSRPFSMTLKSLNPNPSLLQLKLQLQLQLPLILLLPPAPRLHPSVLPSSPLPCSASADQKMACQSAQPSCCNLGVQHC